MSRKQAIKLNPERQRKRFTPEFKREAVRLRENAQAPQCTSATVSITSVHTCTRHERPYRSAAYTLCRLRLWLFGSARFASGWSPEPR